MAILERIGSRDDTDARGKVRSTFRQSIGAAHLGKHRIHGGYQTIVDIGGGDRRAGRVSWLPDRRAFAQQDSYDAGAAVIVGKRRVKVVEHADPAGSRAGVLRQIETAVNAVDIVANIDRN